MSTADKWREAFNVHGWCVGVGVREAPLAQAASEMAQRARQLGIEDDPCAMTPIRFDCVMRAMQRLGGGYSAPYGIAAAAPAAYAAVLLAKMMNHEKDFLTPTAQVAAAAALEALEVHDPGAMHGLAWRLQQALPEIAAAVGLDVADAAIVDPARTVECEEGMLAVDARLVRWLEKRGAKSTAETLRKGAAARWRDWQAAHAGWNAATAEKARRSNPLGFIYYDPGDGEAIAALWKPWHDDDRAELERYCERLEQGETEEPAPPLPWPRILRLIAAALWQADRRPHRGIVRPVATLMLGAFSRGNRVAETRQGELALQRTGTGERIAALSVESAPLQALLETDCKALGTLDAIAIVREQLKRGAEQAANPELYPSPHLLTYRGGRTAAADDAGLRGRDRAAVVESVLRAEQSLVLELGNRRVGGLLTWEEWGKTSNRVLRVALSPYMMPQAHLLDGLGRDGRRYVYVPEYFPPWMGQRWRPEQCNWQQALFLVLAEHPEGYAEEDGLIVLEPRSALLGRISDLSRMPTSRVAQNLDALCRNPTKRGEAPAMLESCARCRYRLAPAYLRAHEMLIGLGRRVLHGRKGGKTATAHKERFDRPSPPRRRRRRK
jgi:hypothetical protein